MKNQPANTAILHDGFTVAGGGERVAIELCRALPASQLFTSAWLPSASFAELAALKPRLLPGARLARSERVFKLLFPLWFLGFRTLNLQGCNLVFSSSSYLAKYARVPAGVAHICYLHNPFRYLWSRGSYSSSSLPLAGAALKLTDRLLPLLRRLDIRYTRELTHVLANSQHMAEKIRAIYDLTAEVVYPPVDTAAFCALKNREDFYLYVGRLVNYKRADLAIEACRQLGRKLLVVGAGPEEQVLKKMPAGEARFLGRIADQELKDLYARARAVIFPGYEDFGLIPLEAQAAGCPVIAYGAGGALESVIENESGVFFRQQNAAALVEAILQAEKIRFSPQAIRKNVLRFDTKVFAQKIRAIAARYKYGDTVE